MEKFAGLQLFEVDHTVGTILTKEAILERTARYWFLDQNYLPFPYAGRLTCLCGSVYWHVRSWEFFQHRDDNHRVMHRCNVAMKCTSCGFAGVWGIAIPEELYFKHVDRPGQSKAYNWRTFI